MIVQIITIQIKAQFTEEFIKLSLEQSDKSMKEKGINRFDVYRSTEDPDRFIYCEEFKTEADIEAHRNTEHFKKWQKEAPAYIISKTKQVLSKLR